MKENSINSSVSERICKHMNKDHNDAVISYAKHYGQIDKIKTATMIRITPESMELEVDGKPLDIRFDHILKDSEDAHKTLVEMLKKLQKPKS